VTASTYRAVAIDYDGTLAQDGIVDPRTLTALTELKAHGVLLVLVTGRQMGSLFGTFPHANLFDRIVFENGALLYTPSNGACRLLSPPAPKALVAMLEQRGVPFAVGSTVVATAASYAPAVLSAIHELGLDWQITLNKGDAMALPAGVTKATGLAPVLAELGIPAAETIGVGDAENDHPVLALCGLAVAVAYALPSRE
jgi:hydroxymethylpyrimidine pyrophosphatase-like HAD family hydrolase